MLCTLPILKTIKELKAFVRFFYQIFIFSPNESPSETMKNVFSPSFPHFPDSKGQMEVE